MLDVGCGYGMLGRALAENGLDNLQVRGLESVRRDGERIPVDAYDGRRFPYEDGSFDVVIVADVLHHEADPEHLLRECVRVSRRLIVVKDHQRSGVLAQSRIALIDWAANAPYGVPCLYRYYTPDQWSRWPQTLGVDLVDAQSSMKLYPQPYQLLFGGRLQYLAVWRVPE